MGAGPALPACCQTPGRFQEIPEDAAGRERRRKSAKGQGFSPEVPRRTKPQTENRVHAQPYWCKLSELWHLEGARKSTP